MESGIDIRRRRDGSVDIEHYVRIARAERIETIRRCVWTIGAAHSRLLQRIAAAHSGVRAVFRIGRV
jgi:hypothetical protein